MPCYHAKPAWQKKLGSPLSFQYVRGWRTLAVPCGTCIGCIKAHAQSWAFRCHLEATRHPNNAFVTLTFDDEHLPFTLDWRRDGAPFLKSLRQKAAGPIRFFASGEYGSRTHRPHYHLLLFGVEPVGPKYHAMVENSWRKGNIQMDPVTPARIAYCAGYTDKKSDDRFNSVAHADPETGEAWQPPFIQMSRRPGLGSHARPTYYGPLTKEDFNRYKTHINSWRLYAIQDGTKQPVPRYYHNAWRQTATEAELKQLEKERDRYKKATATTLSQITAAEHNAVKKQQLQAEERQQKAQKREFHTAGIRRFLGVNKTTNTTT